MIAAEADRLHDFVERVLHFTTGHTVARSVGRERVDLESVCAAALGPLQERIAESGITVRASVDPEARDTCGDADALVLAVRNLVQNALDHAEGVQRVAIDVRASGRHVIISVTDDGAGVPAADRATIFEPFARGTRTRERGIAGHGLGLAIVQEVARAHGGRASYEPRSLGSVFTIIVPLRRASR